MVNKHLLKEAVGWGLGLWFIGYVLGIAFFFFLSPSILGWVIIPIGILITLRVLLKKVKNHSLLGSLMLSITWTLIAVVFDFLFIVMAFKPEDGYYKLDVYIYYAVTFTLPLIIGFWRKSKSGERVD